MTPPILDGTCNPPDDTADSPSGWQTVAIGLAAVAVGCLMGWLIW